MNRPYGAVDVSANLKGAVPKTATQKILLSLAEKGELVQKTYGKKHLHTVYVRFIAHTITISKAKQRFSSQTRQALRRCQLRSSRNLKKIIRRSTKRIKTLPPSSRLYLQVLCRVSFLPMSFSVRFIIATELIRVKNTPTDSELSTTLKETASSVRPSSYFISESMSTSARNLHCISHADLLIENARIHNLRSRRLERVWSLFAQACLLFPQKKWHSWTPTGRIAMLNGFDVKRSSPSACIYADGCHRFARRLACNADTLCG